MISECPECGYSEELLCVHCGSCSECCECEVSETWTQSELGEEE